MSTTAPAKEATPGLRMALDYGPLAVFFAANLLAGKLHLPNMVDSLARVLIATAAFMVATFVAILVSHIKTGRISPMLWITGGLVLVFGGLTLWFRDDTFIKVKPTIVYAMFSAILGFGLATGRPLLQSLLEGAYPGLSAEGWRKLTINWTGFFAAMAVLNELVWRNTSWDFWVGFKLWGAVPLTLLFAIANVPMLLRHGLTTEKEAPVPPEG
ncbi:septation protein A [Sphingomonas sp. ACRSK]|uniref:septation protein A n=1 Tax=Sphingomonas sp. ACRSK TaxID=2918213 RepID=UPI001EF3EF55|nr:septation protein A [Sphingomonas sp. ACRSK]MCG7347375.1 septation protein A [Sphingomonas sp. ACRSK]